MNTHNQLEALSPILKHYHVEPHFVEDFGTVKKIYSSKGIFALKKVLPSVGTDFIRHVHDLYQKGFNRIVPIYPTMDGRYAVLHDQFLYYLMPWIANEQKENREQQNQQLFRELARLHTLSAKEIPINKEERTVHYESTIGQIEKHEEFLDGFMDVCESKTYMSPFELLFCLYYNQIKLALGYSKTKLDEWYELTKNEEKARMVVVHGKLSSEHFLYDERGYGFFINFENARYGSPIHDLLPYISRALNTNPKRNDQVVNSICHYLKYFPFKDEEKLLFHSYLAYPIPIIQVAEKYYRKQRARNELKFVRQLQQRYWHLTNTEYVVSQLAKMEAQQQAEIQAAEEAKEGAQ
ncbi:spore coat protein YsxE [Bacillus thermocopriae]|uniref:Spore coat protein YsxE n=1 Tax=Neobacillus thermocopriae TaxID=1215031 RepID=A0A6B3TN38_9BACI|nr:spore coat protein YsxE [Neobacillus thermocopriae]MED3623662.1 spore coat protein YsxE [Neobacillus thermocopriae]MED3712881.1 spore coat protein YsxE [Neobacillus thermocopriae]NEX78365.1 spore coat protein YsxE [Neobacillus thermocopriae]